MILMNLQLFGGRGSSSGGGGGSSGISSGEATRDSSVRGGESFGSLSDLENSLSGITDPNYGAYESAYNTEFERAREIRNIERQAQETGVLGEWTRSALEGERTDCQNQLDSMPSERTASEWGRSEGLQERISAIDRVLNQDYSGSGFNPNDINIVN